MLKHAWSDQLRFRSAMMVLLVACVGMGPGWPAAPPDDRDVIDYRQDIMKTLGEQSAVLSEIRATAVPPENIVAHIDSIALAASTALESFRPNVPGGQSKPEIWGDWLDFSRRMNQLSQSLAQLSRLAHTQGMDAAKSGIIDAAAACKGCHELYRYAREP